MRFLFLVSFAVCSLAFAKDACQGKQGKALEACRAEMARKPSAAPCQTEADKHCSGFTPNAGLEQCLIDHKPDLSSACAASLPKAK